MIRLMILLVAGIAVMGGERFEEKTFKTREDVHVRVDDHKGHIRIFTTADNAVTINARVYHEEEVPLDRLHLRLEQVGNTVTIGADYDNWCDKAGSTGFFGKGCQLPYIDFEIGIPDGASLDVETHKATVNIDAPRGELSLESHKGTGTIRNIRSMFQMETHKGNFDLEFASFAGFNLETHKGSIRALISGAVDVTVRGSSHKGSLNFLGRNVPVEKEDHESQVHYKMGAGTHPLYLETHKGDITVEFVD